MITIYHLESSRSERIVWLMEELGLPYDLQIFPRSPNGAAPDALKAMQPLGRAPLIRDGDMVLAESGAIVDYIVRRHGNDRLAISPQAPEFVPEPPQITSFPFPPLIVTSPVKKRASIKLLPAPP